MRRSKVTIYSGSLASGDSLQSYLHPQHRRQREAFLDGSTTTANRCPSEMSPLSPSFSLNRPTHKREAIGAAVAFGAAAAADALHLFELVRESAPLCLLTFPKASAAAGVAAITTCCFCLEPLLSLPTVAPGGPTVSWTSTVRSSFRSGESLIARKKQHDERTPRLSQAVVPSAPRCLASRSACYARTSRGGTTRPPVANIVASWGGDGSWGPGDLMLGGGRDPLACSPRMRVHFLTACQSHASVLCERERTARRGPVLLFRTQNTHTARRGKNIFELDPSRGKL
ncbi:Hypothetical predicted protein [Olea europaea subsp. europaea]|uniref:Uncharacterized protein n=1 Tax=Olea europaea subsp. europaea TaxID=158383 RepID=A0A8S0RAG1_OLEEU|nr:Hypothetical predicted protein [Olea europaea subsp. europaea]